MNPLTPPQMDTLVQLIGQTREHEFDCGECQQHVSEFTEKQLAGLPLNEALASVEHHLTVCPECREEWQALEKILRGAM